MWSERRGLAKTMISWWQKHMYCFQWSTLVQWNMFLLGTQTAAERLCLQYPSISNDLQTHSQGFLIFVCGYMAACVWANVKQSVSHSCKFLLAYSSAALQCQTPLNISPILFSLFLEEVNSSVRSRTPDHQCYVLKLVLVLKMPFQK